ncbi:MAG: hypothetical protein J0L82_03125 [Deltaproteobacteria bacterium]|nr:hypothetical protein [Deltaproteobacteria bacterium]
MRSRPPAKGQAPTPKSLTTVASSVSASVVSVVANSVSFVLPAKLRPQKSLNAEQHVTKAIMQISRHDHHNLEIKSVIEFARIPQKITTEVFLYFPKSFEIGLVGKPELAKDFRTRLRLSMPTQVGYEDENFNIALAELKRANSRYELETIANKAMGQEITSDLRDGILEASKDLAAIVAERLKRFSSEHGRQFFLSQSLLANSASRSIGFDQFDKNLQGVRRKVEALRESMRVRTEEGRQLNGLLDEYASQLYVQYLGAVAKEFNQYEASHVTERTEPTGPAAFNDSSSGSTIDGDAGCESARRRARQTLQALQEDEALYRKNRCWSFDTETDLEREQHLIRLSQLKKFFQSKTFVDVAKTQAAKRVNESTALIGTAIAAITAAFIEQFGRKNVATLASQGLLVVGLGVILYVLRDRMKDWARVKLQEKAMVLIPDFETVLVANQKRFGISREWLQIQQSKAVEPAVNEARHAESVIDRSLRLPEDVLYLRRVFFLDPGFDSQDQTRSLHENVRLNLDRHLKFMDDPFKDLTDLEADGRIVFSRSHRVYHFHMVTRTTLLTGPFAKPSKLRVWKHAVLALMGIKTKLPAPDKTEIATHRVVLDKSGIVRVESLHG